MGGGCGVCQAKSGGKGNHSQVDGQQEPTADIAVGVTLGGNIIPFALLGNDVGQKGVIEDVAAGESQGSQNNQERGEQPLSFPYKGKQNRSDYAHISEKSKESALGMGAVGDGTQYGSEKNDKNERDRLGVAPIGGLGGVIQSAGGDIGIVDRHHRRHDGGGKGGVGPVIHNPGADRSWIHRDHPLGGFVHIHYSQSGGICPALRFPFFSFKNSLDKDLNVRDIAEKRVTCHPGSW